VFAGAFLKPKYGSDKRKNFMEFRFPASFWGGGRRRGKHDFEKTPEKICRTVSNGPSGAFDFQFSTYGKFCTRRPGEADWKKTRPGQGCRPETSGQMECGLQRF